MRLNIKKLDGGKDRKEKTMKRKHGVFFGFAVLMIAAMFTVAGCGDSGSGDPTTPPGGATTVKLTKQGDNVLVLTLTGTQWSNTADAGASPNAIANLIFGNGSGGTSYFNYVNYSGQIQSDKAVLHITVTKQDDKTGSITYQLSTANSKLSSLFMYTTEFLSNPMGYDNFSIASGSETVTITIN
jgi:hypothetical protein